MRSINPWEWRAIGWESVRFLVAGVLNTAASYGLYLLLLGPCPYAVAYTLSYVFGIGLAYGLMCRFVFRQRERLGSALGFPVVYGVQYVLGLALLTFFVGTLRVDPRLGPLLVIACTVPISFVLSARVIRGSGPSPMTAPRG